MSSLSSAVGSRPAEPWEIHEPKNKKTRHATMEQSAMRARRKGRAGASEPARDAGRELRPLRPFCGREKERRTKMPGWGRPLRRSCGTSVWRWRVPVKERVLWRRSVLRLRRSVLALDLLEATAPSRLRVAAVLACPRVSEPLVFSRGVGRGCRCELLGYCGLAAVEEDELPGVGVARPARRTLCRR